MPTHAGGGVVYPFGRWSRGYVLGELDPFAREVQNSTRTGLKRCAYGLFIGLFALSVGASSDYFGGPFITAQSRAQTSSAVVTLPTMLYFVGRRLLVWRRVRHLPHGPYLGRLFVAANVENALGAAARHPSGAYVVAPWLDAGRRYSLDALDEHTARRIVWGCIIGQILIVCLLCTLLIGCYHQPPSCIYGITLYFSVLQPALMSVEMHIWLPFFAQPWHPRTFDDETIIVKRYRWLRVFVVSSVYMAGLLLWHGPESLNVKVATLPQLRPAMQTYLYLAAYATATCYTILSLVCLLKTWSRAWSLHSTAKSFFARSIFLLALVFFLATICKAI